MPHLPNAQVSSGGCVVGRRPEGTEWSRWYMVSGAEGSVCGEAMVQRSVHTRTHVWCVVASSWWEVIMAIQITAAVAPFMSSGLLAFPCGAHEA